MVRSKALGVALALVCALLTARAAPISGVDTGGPALEGYDTVSYFTQGEPVKGSAEFATAWSGATWWFASAQHRDLFAADPEKYAPQYGGWCAYATAHDLIATGDPRYWHMEGGKLYLNNNRFAHTLWQRDRPGFIRDGDRLWPGVSARIEAKRSRDQARRPTQ